MIKPQIFASHLEGSAELQLQQTANLFGIKDVVAHPDVHLSKACAVGTTALTNGVVYPHLIGNDIGCGFSCFITNIPVNKFKAEQKAELLIGLDNQWNSNVQQYLDLNNVESNHYNGIGTLGGGNHFLEWQKIVSVADETALKLFGVDTEFLVLLVHSGSRSLGESIFYEFAALCGNKGLTEKSDYFEAYIKSHNTAVKWAKANRLLIAQRALQCLNAEGKLLGDLPHNFVEQIGNDYLHRKGAAPADRGISPLPGSRGTPTYLLNPLSQKALSSLAHGAGRKSSRANMHGRVTESAKQMSKTPLGGIVVCSNELLMREEHHTAYKNVDKVLADVKEFGLATDIATLHPVLTYKSERKKEGFEKKSKRDKEESWRQERRDSHRNRR